jgi:molybdate transport system permease protein
MPVWQHDLVTAIGLSLRLSVITSLLLIGIGLPLAGWLARSRARWAILVEVVVTLPIVLPPTVIGFYLLVLSSPHHFLGALWQDVFGSPLPFSFSGLVMGSVVYSLPFAVQPMVSAIRGVDPTLVEAASALGASLRRVFWHIIVPAARHGIVGGAVLSFAHTMGEFGVVLMLGGNIPGRTRVASIALYDRVENLDYNHANAMAIILLALAVVTLLVVGWIRQRHTATALGIPWARSGASRLRVLPPGSAQRP